MEVVKVTVFVVLEDIHYEGQTLVAACKSLENAKRIAQEHSNKDILPSEPDDEPRPILAEFIAGKQGTSSTYFGQHAYERIRKWVSKGTYRDYEIWEIELRD